MRQEQPEHRQAEQGDHRSPAGTTRSAAQPRGERSRSATAGTPEPAGTAASDTFAAGMSAAAGKSAYRPEAPLAEKAVAEVEAAADQ
jgi:hypothetical protein